MSLLPTDPVSPREFVEDVIPAAFAELELDEDAQRIELKLGISLRSAARDSEGRSEGGSEGGEWTLHFIEGELGIAAGLAPDCTLTLIQSVEDWRSALWEGRPGLVSDVVQRLARSGPNFPRGAAHGAPAPQNPEALRELERLPGRIDAIVVGDDVPDWRIGLHIGPGPIPATPRATIRVGSIEAEAIRRGELNPIEALITGQLRLEGDLGLILQLQAIAMAASMPPPPSGSPDRR